MSDGLFRALYNDEEEPPRSHINPEYVRVTHEYLRIRRDTLIMELRGIERIMVEEGLLKGESLPRRVR